MNFIKKIPGTKIFVNEERTGFYNCYRPDFPHEIARQVVRMKFSIVDLSISSVYMGRANLTMSLRDLDTNMIYTIPNGDINAVISIIDNAITNGSTPIACFRTQANGSLKLEVEE